MHPKHQTQFLLPYPVTKKKKKNKYVDTGVNKNMIQWTNINMSHIRSVNLPYKKLDLFHDNWGLGCSAGVVRVLARYQY